jgi:hypothetical protein
MCRSIKTLRNAEIPATQEDIRAAALQYVRKVSGFRQPSKANHDVFAQSVGDIAAITKQLLDNLVVRGR